MSKKNSDSLMFFDYDPENTVLSTQPRSKVPVVMEKHTGRTSQIIGIMDNKDRVKFASIKAKPINWKSVDKHIPTLLFPPADENKIGRDLGIVNEVHVHLEYPNKYKNLDKIQKQPVRNVFIDKKRVIPRHKHFYNYAMFGKVGNTDGKSKRITNEEKEKDFYDPPSTCQYNKNKQKVDKDHCKDVHDFGKSGRDNIRVCGGFQPARDIKEEWWGGTEEPDYIPPMNIKPKLKTKGMIDMRKMLPRNYPEKATEPEIMVTEENEDENYIPVKKKKRKKKKRRKNCVVNMKKQTGREAVLHLGMFEENKDADADISKKNKKRQATYDMLYSGTTRYRKKSVKNQIKTADMLIMHSVNALNELRKSFPI